VKILFVCSGNICRSPMAAECFRHHAAGAGLSHVVVESAGTLGIEGAAASSQAIEALEEIGLDLTRHRSRALDRADIRTSEFVIAMTRDHLEELARRFPEGDGERFLLRSFERGRRPDSDAPDLDDPMGRSLRFYRKQLSIIRASVEHLALFLRHLP
jgi:protein-tyrosine-phosphatase